MLRIARGSLVAGIVLCTAASAAAGQLPNNIYPIPRAGSGVTFAGDFARGLNSDAGKANYAGIRVRSNFGWLVTQQFQILRLVF